MSETFTLPTQAVFSHTVKYLQTLYQFVEAYPIIQDDQIDTTEHTKPPSNYTHKYEFTIMTPYPRTVFQPSNDAIKDQSMLWPSATLVVDLLEDDEDDNEVA
jgi:FAS-associated factor 2